MLDFQKTESLKTVTGLVDPGNNLKETSKDYKDFYDRCGVHKGKFIFQMNKPPLDDFRRDFVTSTVYLYSGHNSGLEHLKPYLKQHPPTRLPFTFLFGCKSLEFTVTTSGVF
jgi:hypothetical protein